MCSGFVFGLANGYAKRKESTAKIRSFIQSVVMLVFSRGKQQPSQNNSSNPLDLNFSLPCKCCSTIAQVCLFCPMGGDGKLNMWWDHDSEEERRE